MGFDISYHPITEQEIQEWYFDVLADNSKIDRLCSANAIDDFYAQKYKHTIALAAKTQPAQYFDKTHGYAIAVIQGFFRKYYYTRGSAFSFLIEEKPEYKRYTKSWQDIYQMTLPNPISNKIMENYCSGVYIPADKVIKLLHDYRTNNDIKEELDHFYSEKRIEVFLTALDYCKENNCGLLEATEVVEPNPFDMPKSTSYSNLFNCDKEGVYLYMDAAAQQIKQIEEANNLEHGEILKNAEYVKTDVGTAEMKKKKGFWKKLFSK